MSHFPLVPEIGKVTEILLGERNQVVPSNNFKNNYVHGKSKNTVKSKFRGYLRPVCERKWRENQ